VVSSYGPHFGEEAPLVGTHGSGTIFFAYCNLCCCYCQNHNISQQGEGEPVNSVELSEMMLSLEARGCHNINLVSPTHVVPYFLEALVLAAAKGLAIPVVYNTGGYDSVDTLRLLDGIIDIYMPDMKYADAGIAERLSGIKEYPEINKLAIREMYRQVGDLKLDSRGIAQRGLLVRHLVLPHNLAGTEEILKFLSQAISGNTYLNIMAQYRPCYHASDEPELVRPITSQEYDEAVAIAHRYGMNRLDNGSPYVRFRLIRE
jgi:putative pyruvate formate lyase activating enzyme